MSRVIRVAAGPGRSFIKVRLPKGTQSLTPRLSAAIDRSPQRLSSREGCIVFFARGKAIQRCEGRKLKGSNKNQCRNAKKKFVKCTGGKKRRGKRR